MAMITKIASGTRELALTGRWDTEELVPYGGARTIKLKGSFVGSGSNARAMLKTAQAEFMGAVELCSHSGGQVALHSYMGDVEIRMPARYLGAKQVGDRATAQAGCAVELEFQCLSHFWLGATASDIADLSSGSCTLVMANSGTAPARPAVIVRSTGYIGAIGLALEDGRAVEWSGMITNNEAIVFDMASRQVYTIYALAPATYPTCPGASSLVTSEVKEYTDWLSTVWEMGDGEEIFVTADPDVGLTAELVHINEYY